MCFVVFWIISHLNRDLSSASFDDLDSSYILSVNKRCNYFLTSMDVFWSKTLKLSMFIIFSQRISQPWLNGWELFIQIFILPNSQKTQLTLIRWFETNLDKKSRKRTRNTKTAIEKAVEKAIVRKSGSQICFIFSLFC